MLTFFTVGFSVRKWPVEWPAPLMTRKTPSRTLEMPFETLQTRSSFRSRTGEWRLHAPTPNFRISTPLVCVGEMKTKTKSCSTSSAGRLPPHSPRDASIQEGKDKWACGRCVATVSSACLGRCTHSQDGSAPHYALPTPSSFPFPPHPPPSPLESKWASSIIFSLHNGSIVHSLSRRIHPLSLLKGTANSTCSH